MDMPETEQLLLSAQRLKDRELQPESWEDPYSDMNPDEKSKLLIELTRQLRESQQLIQSLLQKIDKLTESQQVANEEIRSLREQLTNQNKLMVRIATLEEELRLARKHRFGSHQQRGVKKSDKDKNEPTSHEEAKGGFDGTEGSLPEDVKEDVAEERS